MPATVTNDHFTEVGQTFDITYKLLATDPLIPGNTASVDFAVEWTRDCTNAVDALD